MLLFTIKLILWHIICRPKKQAQLMPYWTFNSLRLSNSWCPILILKNCDQSRLRTVIDFRDITVLGNRFIFIEYAHFFQYFLSYIIPNIQYISGRSKVNKGILININCLYNREDLTVSKYSSWRQYFLIWSRYVVRMTKRWVYILYSA